MSSHEASSNDKSVPANTAPRLETNQPTNAPDNQTAQEPESPAKAAGAERAMSATEAWKPNLNRRQSWDNQEYKHKLMMSQISDTPTGPGFSEK